MPRPVSAWWDRKSGRYYVRLGPISEKTGKRRSLMLCDERGRPLARGDARGVAAAIQRRLAELDAERRGVAPTVAELCQQYLDWHRAEGSKPATIETHKTRLGQFCGHKTGGVLYADREAAEITVEDLTAFRKAKEAAGWDTGTVRQAYASILAAWNWASRPIEGRPGKLIAVNPFDRLPRPRKGAGRRAVLPWPAIRALVEFAESRAEHNYAREIPAGRLKALALRLIAESGCRPGEAVGLRWEWVDLGERIAVIPAGHHKTGRSTGRDRVIGLTEGMAAKLAAVRAERIGHPELCFVVRWRESLTVPKFNDWFRRLRTAAIEEELPIPEDCTPYTLRHSWVTQGQEGGVDVAEVAKAAGHSRQVAESTYTHHAARYIRAIVDRVNEARGRED